MNYPYLCPVIINQKKEEQTMARPIKETPILFGEEARRFEERMKHPKRETPAEREQRLKSFRKFQLKN